MCIHTYTYNYNYIYIYIYIWLCMVLSQLRLAAFRFEGLRSQNHCLLVYIIVYKMIQYNII